MINTLNILTNDPMSAIILSALIVILAVLGYSFITDAVIQRKYRGEQDKQAREHFKNVK